MVGLENVPKLVAIKLRGNQVEKFEDEETLPELPSISHINLRECPISSLQELKKLLFYTTLGVLNVLGTPLAEEHADATKKEVLIVMPKLKEINGEAVESEDREDAIGEAEERHRLAEDARLEAERAAKEAEEKDNEEEEEVDS